MKKTALFLAALLALAGCAPESQPTQGVPEESGTSSQMESSASQAETQSQSSSQEESSAPSSSSVQEQSQPEKTSPEQLEAPDEIPAATVEALELPAQLFTGEAGYSVEALTPAQYEASLTAQRGGPQGFVSTDIFQLGQGGKYAIANANGKIITDFIYDHTDGNLWESYGLVIVTKDGMTGVISVADGSEVVPANNGQEYTGIYPNGLIYLGDPEGDSWRIINQDGSLRYQMERGDKLVVAGDGEFLLQEGMLRIYDHDTGKLVTNMSCEDIELAALTAEGDAFDGVSIQNNGVWGVLDTQGETIITPDYDEPLTFDGDYAKVKQNGKYGVVNYKGELVVKLRWDDLILGNGMASVCSEDRWGVIGDLDTNELTVSPHYDFVGRYQNGYASFERNGRYGLLDKDGNEIIAAKYDTMITAEPYLEKGYFLLEGDGPGSAGIVGDGKVLLPTDNYIWGTGLNGYTAPDEPYILFQTSREKFGYLDGTGKIVIDAQFDMADGFLAGKDVAFVKKDGKIGLINRQGTMVLETVFSDLVCFNPETMVGLFQYTSGDTTKACLAKINLKG